MCHVTSLNLICIGNVAQIIKPSTVAITLLKTRDELCGLLQLIRSWRINGINGSGVVPIAILPLEAKLEKSIKDIESMIKIAANV